MILLSSQRASRRNLRGKYPLATSIPHCLGILAPSNNDSVEKLESTFALEEACPSSRATMAVRHVRDARLLVSLATRVFRPFRCCIFQISEVATEGDISRFVMQSYRSFEQDFYENVLEHRPTARILGSDGEPYVDVSSADPVGADLRSGPRPHFFASVMREGANLRSSGVVDMMTRMTRIHSRRFQQIEHATGR